MAQFFAVLLALWQAPAPPVSGNRTPISLDARWVTAFETPAAAAPGFDGQSAYVPLNGGQLVAVDLDRGTIRWTLDLETKFTPATGDDLVFTVAGDVIEARDGATGELRWRTSLPGGAAAPLYYDTGWLIASTASGDLAAFRASDGTLVWRRELGAPLVARPGPALKELFLPLADNRLLAVQLETGATAWELKVGAPITALLALDEQVVFGTSAKFVVSVDVRNGQERWQRRMGGDMAGTPIADDKRVYYATRDNMLWAVDRNSGNLRWNASLAARPAGGPLQLGLALLMPLVSNQIVGFAAQDGKQAVTAAAAGEVGLQPYVRPGVRQTQPQVITVSRDGQLQGFGRRYEPIPAALSELPGTITNP